MIDWPLYVGWFMRRHMMPAPSRERVDVADAYRAFLRWWADGSWWDEPPSVAPGPPEFAAALAKLCSEPRNRLRVELEGRRVYCCGARFAG